MKVLNLYAGIGGNRKLWTDCEITAVEINENIAKIYKDFFPDDEVIIADAHQYLLDHYKEYDFIWSSPPCPSHSNVRLMSVYTGRIKAVYPEMSLYQEIILLKNFALKNSKWVIENVRPYYDYLIKPSIILNRHPFWCNFKINKILIKDDRKHTEIKNNSIVYGVSLEKYKNDKKYRKDKILRNMVNPELGLYIFNEARGIIKDDEKTLFNLGEY